MAGHGPFHDGVVIAVKIVADADAVVVQMERAMSGHLLGPCAEFLSEAPRPDAGLAGPALQPPELGAPAKPQEATIKGTFFLCSERSSGRERR